MSPEPRFTAHPWRAWGLLLRTRLLYFLSRGPVLMIAFSCVNIFNLQIVVLPFYLWWVKKSFHVCVSCSVVLTFAIPSTVAHQARILYCLSHQGSPPLSWGIWQKIREYLILSGASWLLVAHTWAASWRKNVAECSPERMWPFYCPCLWGMLLLTSFRKHRESPEPATHSKLGLYPWAVPPPSAFWLAW